MAMNVDDAIIDRRVSDLLRHYSGANDCRVIAETEAMQLEYLVSRDDKLSPRSSAPHGDQDHASDGAMEIARHRLCACAFDGPCAGKSLEYVYVVAPAGLLKTGRVGGQSVRTWTESRDPRGSSPKRLYGLELLICAFTVRFRGGSPPSSGVFNGSRFTKSATDTLTDTLRFQPRAQTISGQRLVRGCRRSRTVPCSDH